MQFDSPDNIKQQSQYHFDCWPANSDFTDTLSSIRQSEKRERES